MKSKETKILELFFNEPRRWHFEELLKAANITRPQLARWLKIFEENGIIKRIKPKGKMPYYIHNFNHPKFQNMKKLFAYTKLTETGLFDHLVSLDKAKIVILFGSFTRADWYKDSDIDIFIYGSDDGFNQGKFELKLRREIQVHTAKNAKDLKKMDRLLPYIVSGTFVKGSIQDLGVEVHAKT